MKKNWIKNPFIRSRRYMLLCTYVKRRKTHVPKSVLSGRHLFLYIYVYTYQRFIYNTIYRTEALFSIRVGFSFGEKFYRIKTRSVFSDDGDSRLYNSIPWYWYSDRLRDDDFWGPNRVHTRRYTCNMYIYNIRD